MKAGHLQKEEKIILKKLKSFEIIRSDPINLSKLFHCKLTYGGYINQIS